MDITKAIKLISWEQGLFLQPQHLQLTDHVNHHSLIRYFQLLNPFFWGVHRCQYESDLITKQIFSLTAATFIMPDGSLIELTDNASFQPRSFAEVVKHKPESFQVFLGVKQLQIGLANVTEQPSASVQDCNTRFVTDKEMTEYPDLYFQGPAANIRQLKYVVRIFWDSEAKQLQNYNLLPIAKIVCGADGTYHLDSQFSPPLLILSASENMLTLISQFFTQLTERVKQLEALKHSVQYYEQPTNQIKILILQTLARSISTIAHLLHLQAVAPIQFYQILINLIAELSVFSQDLNLVTEDAAGGKLVPPFNHEAPYPCFKKLCDLVMLLLDQIFVGAQHLCPAKKENNMYIAQLNSAFLTGKNHFYLLIQAAPEQLATVSQHVLTIAKLCAYSEMNKILEYALPGIPLEKLAAVPEGTPRLSNCLYFSIDKADAAWNQIDREKKLAFYIGNLSTELTINFASTNS
jgi:type VI secretion system protein ImpJ